MGKQYTNFHIRKLFSEGAFFAFFRQTIIVFLLFSFLTLLGCAGALESLMGPSEKASEVSLSSIQISTSPNVVMVIEELPVKIDTHPLFSKEELKKRVYAEVENPLIATISDDFVVIGRKEGHTVVKIYDKNRRDIVSTAAVVVVSNIYLGKLDHFAIAPSISSISDIETEQFTCQGFDRYNFKVDVTPNWSVSDGIGLIDQNGLFTASKPGEGYVSVSSGNVVGSVNITVSRSPSRLQRLELRPKPELVEDEITQFYVDGIDQYQEIMSTDITWTIHPGSVGSLSSTGKYQTVQNGFASITARSGLYTVSHEFEVDLPPTPNHVVAWFSNNNTRVFWTLLPDADYYSIYRSSTQSGPFVEIADNVVSEINVKDHNIPITKPYADDVSGYYIDTSADVSETYYYKVRAHQVDDPLGISHVSEIQDYRSVLYKSEKLSQSAFTVTQDDDSNIYLTVLNPEDDYTYYFYRSLDEQGEYDLVGTYTPPNDIESGLGWNLTYYYKLMVENEYGNQSPLSNAKSIILYKPLPEAKDFLPPEALQATDDQIQKIQLSWQAVVDATHYSVHRSTSETGPFTQIIASVDEPLYEDAAITAGETYYYLVKAHIRDKMTTDASDIASGLARPASLVNATLVAPSDRSDSIQLTWPEMDYSNYYSLYRSTSEDGDYQLLATNLDELTYRDDTVEVNQLYYYKIKAHFDETLASELSEAVTGLRRPSALAVPVADATSDRSDMVHVEWSSIQYATQYAIYRSTDANTGYDLLSTGIQDTYYKDTAATADTLFYYKVKAIYDDLLSSSLSNAVQGFKRPSELDAPDLSASRTTANKIELNWNSVNYAKSYQLERSSDGSSFDVIGDALAGTSYDDTSAKPEQDNYYRVKAIYDESLSSDYSDMAVGTTVINNLPKTTVTATSDLPYRIDVSWDAVDNATGYYVFRSESSSGSKDLVMSTTETTFTDPSEFTFIEPNKTYYYYIVALYNSIDSGYSAPATGRATSTLDAPELIDALGAYDGIDIMWVPVVGVSQYEVYRSSDETQNYYKIGTTSDISFADNSGTAELGQTYYYKVRAIDGTEFSAFSNSDSAARVQLNPPIVSIESHVGSIDISWPLLVDENTMYSLNRYDSEDNLDGQILIEDTALSYSDDSIEFGSNYSYRVQAIRNDNISEWSIPVAGSLAQISEPEDVTAEGLYSGIKVTWSAVDGASGYDIFRSSTEDGEYSVLISNHLAIEYVDDSMRPGDTYYYKIKATKDSNVSEYSDSVSATQLALGIPTGLSAEGSYTDISVSWTAVENASGYKVYRSTSSGGLYDDYLGQVDGELTYSDDTASDGTTYYYKVKAVVQVGEQLFESEFSDGFASSQLLDIGVPGGVFIQMFDSYYLGLSFTGVEGAEQYEIKRSTSSDTGYETVGTVDASDEEFYSYNDTTAAIETYYYYKVRAKIGERYSEYSELDEHMFPYKVDRLSSPDTFERSLHWDYIELTWSENLSAAYYNIYVATSIEDSESNNFTKLAGNITELSYQDTSIPLGSTYYYKITAQMEHNESDINESTAVFGARDSILAPVGVAANVVDTSINVSWTAVTGATHYDVYRSETEGSGYNAIASNLEAFLYADEDIEDNTTYYYKIKAKRTTGSQVSDYSDSAGATYIALTAPDGMSVSATTAHIEIDWDSVDNAVHYYVYRAVDGEDYSQLAIVDAPTTVYQDTAAEMAVDYNYYVKAERDSFYSDASDIVSDYKRIPAPVIVNDDEMHGTSITVSWNAVAGVDRYTVFEGAVDQSPGEDITTTYLTIETSAGTHNYTVRAVKVDKESAASEVSEYRETELVFDGVGEPLFTAVKSAISSDDDILYDRECWSITALSISDESNGLMALTELDELINLETLNFSNTGLDGDALSILGNLDNLRIATLNNNAGFIDIEIAGLDSLEELYISNAENMTDLVLNDCSAIKTIMVTNNATLESFNTNSKSTIETLNFSSTGIGGMPFNFDASGYESLSVLNFSDCSNIYEFNLSNLSHDVSLNLSECAMMNSFSFDSTKTKIIDLDLSNINYNDTLTLDGFSNVETIDLSDNMLKGIVISNADSLTTLDLSSISDMDGCGVGITLSNCSALESYDMTGSERIFRYFTFINCESLSGALSFSGVDVYELSINNCGYTSIDVSNQMQLSIIDISNCSSLTTISAAGDMVLEESNISNCSSLTTIDLSSVMSLISPMFSDLPNLSSLNLADCQVLERIDMDAATIDAGANVGGANLFIANDFVYWDPIMNEANYSDNSAFILELRSTGWTVDSSGAPEDFGTDVDPGDGGTPDPEGGGDPEGGF